MGLWEVLGYDPTNGISAFLDEARDWLVPFPPCEDTAKRRLGRCEPGRRPTPGT